MTSKEALRTIFINCKEKMVDKNGCVVNSENLVKTIKQDLDRLEKLEKAIEILKDKFKFELGVVVLKEKNYYSLEFLYTNQYFIISQKQYELLKEVLGNV